MLLTQSTTPIIGWIATLLGYVMEFIFYCLNFIGIQNIGLCIIIFTIIVRLLMLPLTIKQQKFAKISQVMQPEINKIQRKYRNKTDQASMMKQNEEIQKVYEKYGTNPTGGCLQLVIQMPIFLALYQVIRKIPAYIPQVKAVYMQVVTAIAGQAGAIDAINKIGKGLKSSYVTSLASDATKNQIIDTLNYFNADAWHKLAKAIPSAADVINTSSTHIIGMNDFFAGINVSQTPGFHPSIYWLIPILAALFQYLSAKTMKQPELDGNNPAAGMTKSMTVMMPLMSLYFCLVTPAGLGIYWVTSALFQCLQQVIINKYMDNADIDALVAKNKEKAAKKDRKHLWKDSWIPLLRQMPQKRRLRILPQERQLSKLLPLIQRKSLDQKEQVQKIMPILILLISASLEKLVKRLIWYLSMRRNMDIPGEVRSSGS